MIKHIINLFQKVKLVVFYKDGTCLTYTYCGPNAWNTMFQKRLELDEQNLRYKVYERNHFRWIRRHTIQDLLVEDD